MKKITTVISLVCLIGIFLSQIDSFAQDRSDKIKPKWVTQALPESKSGTYLFVRGFGEGATLQGAKQQAFISMSQMLEAERGLTVNTSVQIREQLSQTQTSTSTEYQQEIVLDVTEKGRQLKIVCREIDEYWELTNGRYSVNVLYTVSNRNAQRGNYDDKITVTARYGLAGFLSVVPGVGQFYKGSIAKGSLILGGEILAAGGIILCENTRAAYIKKMQEQPKYASEYNSLANQWEIGRNISIGVAAAIYITNLIDAFATTGAKHIVVQQGRTTLSAAPYVDSRSAAVGFALKF